MGGSDVVQDVLMVETAGMAVAEASEASWRMVVKVFSSREILVIPKHLFELENQVPALFWG